MSACALLVSLSSCYPQASDPEQLRLAHEQNAALRQEIVRMQQLIKQAGDTNADLSEAVQAKEQELTDALNELKVVKRNNEREDFDQDKLRKGIQNACYKRPIDPEEINRLIDDVSQSLQRDFEREVASSEIGSRVMQALRKLDQVAYVRFASVYRKFHDVEEFIDEIRSLQ